MNAIQFPNAEGTMLSGALDMPANHRPSHYAIFAHCFTCSKNLHTSRNISRALTAQGIAVLRFDFSGLGQSEGEFEDTNFSANLNDIEAAAQWLATHHKAPDLLVGHSLGGAAALIAASRIGSIQAVATIGAPAEPDHVTHLFGENLDELRANGIANVNIGGRPFPLKQQFVDDLTEHNLGDTLTAMRKAILLLHSPQDTIVGIHNAAALYERAHHSKSFVSLDGADHLLTDEEDSMYAGTVIGTWAKRYLKQGETEIRDGVFVALQGDSYTSEVMIRQHQFLADEPKDLGGRDLGGTPYELVAAGLGACTAMTLKMYANRKDWNLESVEVEVSHNKIHAEECEHCEQETGKVDRFSRKIKVWGELDEQQVRRLNEIANKCPVHKTLETQSDIQTSTKKA